MTPVVRPAPLHPLPAARRKVEVERLARASLRRQAIAADPRIGAGWRQLMPLLGAS
jgi:hypothetical protein